MADKFFQKYTFCSKYKGTFKKIIIACRKCQLKSNCIIFKLHTNPELAFEDSAFDNVNPLKSAR